MVDTNRRISSRGNASLVSPSDRSVLRERQRFGLCDDRTVAGLDVPVRVPHRVGLQVETSAPYSAVRPSVPPDEQQGQVRGVRAKTGFSRLKSEEPNGCNDAAKARNR